MVVVPFSIDPIDPIDPNDPIDHTATPPIHQGTVGNVVLQRVVPPSVPRRSDVQGGTAAGSCDHLHVGGRGRSSRPYRGHGDVPARGARSFAEFHFVRGVQGEVVDGKGTKAIHRGGLVGIGGGKAMVVGSDGVDSMVERQANGAIQVPFDLCRLGVVINQQSTEDK